MKERPVKHIPWESSRFIPLSLNFSLFFLLSQTLLLLQSLHPSLAILSPRATQSPLFVKFCPSSLLFLQIHSHLPLPCYYVLHQSFMLKQLSFPLSFIYNHSLSILTSNFVWKAPSSSFPMKHTRYLLTMSLVSSPLLPSPSGLSFLIQPVL